MRTRRRPRKPLSTRRKVEIALTLVLAVLVIPAAVWTVLTY